MRWLGHFKKTSKPKRRQGFPCLCTFLRIVYILWMCLELAATWRFPEPSAYLLSCRIIYIACLVLAGGPWWRLFKLKYVAYPAIILCCIPVGVALGQGVSRWMAFPEDGLALVSMVLFRCALLLFFPACIMLKAKNK